MKNIKIILVLLFTSILSWSNLLAKGAGSSGGLSLLEPSGARPAALGEAFTGATNDITALGYNPASLKSLGSGQALFMYQKGMAEDSYGELMMGSPFSEKSSLGISLGFYNGGSMVLNDGVNPERNVTAMKDITFSLGYARKMGGMSVGVAGKYLNSKLVDQYSANAMAVDLGMQMGLGKMTLGGAIQNLGTKMTYQSEGDSLPRIARAGLSAPAFKNTTLFVDMPYYMNEKQVRPGLGAELMFGPLAVRAGYNGGDGLQKFSFGAGFMLGRSSLDYSFGMVDQLQSQHRISMGMHFGGLGTSAPQIVRQPRETQRHTLAEVAPTKQEKNIRTAETKPSVTFVQKDETSSWAVKSSANSNRKIYVVKSGDTLAKIAQKQYGDLKMWRQILTANRHLLDKEGNIEVGQQLLLP